MLVPIGVVTRTTAWREPKWKVVVEDTPSDGEFVAGAEHKVESVWRKLAPEHGLRVERSTDGRGLTMVGGVEGLEARIWAENLGDPEAPRWAVCVQARRAGAEWPRVEVRNETNLTRLGKRFGLDWTDVQVGDRPFDDAFHVHASDADTARSLLGTDARNALRALPGALRLMTDGDSVHLEWEGDPLRAEDIGHACVVLSAIARACVPGTNRPYR